jgi:hypothetical protein
MKSKRFFCLLDIPDVSNDFLHSFNRSGQ